MNNFIIEPHYLPVIRYFTYLFHADHFIIDDVSLFEKQSYRNRTYIGGANGKICLTVPVVKGKTSQIFRDVRIDYSSYWQHIHWKSIVSAYNNSPYFEYMQHLYEPFFNNKFEFLIDLNLELTLEVARQLHLHEKVMLLSEYPEKAEHLTDFRNQIHPKAKYNKIDTNYREKEYIQVFSERFGYQNGLSILDMVFSLGPDTVINLKGNISREADI